MKRKVILILMVLIPALAVPSAAGDQRMQAIADRLYGIMTVGGDRLGYSGFVLDFLEKVYDTVPGKRKRKYAIRHLSSFREREPFDPYSLLSGGLAIRESLQLESIRPAGREGGEVKISQLRGPSIKSHPFREMLKGRSSKVFPLSRLVPEDFYYVHFNNMSGSLDFFDYLGSVGGSLHKRFGAVSVDYMLKEKILTQLALMENKTARRFYNLVIGEMAITGSDPFIMEGADISILYRIKSPVVFNSRIKSYRKYFIDKYGCRREKRNISGVRADYIFTPDRRVNSYLVPLDEETILISNSASAAGIIVDTYKKKRKPLAEADDFRYMRSIYPADDKQEDGFIYLSDPFIRHLVGPRLRIGEARRMKEAARLATGEKYLLLYHQLHGRSPGTVSDLMSLVLGPGPGKTEKEKIERVQRHPLFPAAQSLPGRDKRSWYYFNHRLAEKSAGSRKYGKSHLERAERFSQLLKKTYGDLMKGQKGSPANVLELVNREDSVKELFRDIRIGKNGFSLVSGKYGRNNFMKPNIDNRPETVSNEEAREYNRFVKEYSNFWKTFFDPIGIRFKRGGGIRIETCILPLINNSIYNALREFSGGEPVSLRPEKSLPGDIFSLAVKFNKITILDKIIFGGTAGRVPRNSMAENLLPSVIFGKRVEFHMADTLPLVDFDGRFIFRKILRRGISGSDLLYGMLAWSMFHPVRISLPLTRPRNAGKMLDLLIASRLQTGSSLQVRRYSYDYGPTMIRVVKITLFKTISFRLYLAIKNNHLHISTNESYLKKVLEYESDKRWKSKKESSGNITALFRPGELKQEKNLHTAGILESAQQASFGNYGTIRLLHYLFPGERNLQERSLEYFGFTPVCPLGGEYRMEGERVSNTIFGTLARPVIRFKKIQSDVLKRFFSTELIRLDLMFTPEGIKTGIQTR